MYIENVDHTASHMQAYLSVFSYFLFNEDLNTILNSALCVGCLRAGSPLGTTGNTHHMNVQLIHTHTLMNLVKVQGSRCLTHSHMYMLL